MNNLSERLSYFHITAYSVMQPVFFIALITNCTWFLLFVFCASSSMREGVLTDFLAHHCIFRTLNKVCIC